MNATHLFAIVGAVFMSAVMSGETAAQRDREPYVQVAEIEIDPAQLGAYHAAVQEQIEAAVRLEPGVLKLFAVADAANPTRVRVFEIYRDIDAYRLHLESPHFKKYKAATETMVTHLNLMRTIPIMLGEKSK